MAGFPNTDAGVTTATFTQHAACQTGGPASSSGVAEAGTAGPTGGPDEQ